jgi:hypothetical protein
MTVLEILRAHESDLRLLRSEASIAFDTEGNIVLEKGALPGKEYEIEFSDDEIALLRQIGKVTVTHNHPRGWAYPPDDPRHAGSSFSPEDILLACRAQLEEVRAVTPVYTFSMRPPPENDWTEGTWTREIRPLYEMVYPQVKSKLYAAALRGELSPSEASVRLDHEVWTEVAWTLGLRYTRVEE